MNLKKKMKKILYLFPVKWINKFYLFYNRIFYPELVERKMSFGEKNEDKIFYVIRPRKNSVEGLMALLFYVIQQIGYAEKNNYIPVVDFKNYKTQYNIADENAWECFFEQISNYSLEEVYQSKNVVLSGINAIYDTYSYLYNKSFNEDDLQKTHLLAKKYIKFSKKAYELYNKELKHIIQNVLHKSLNLTGRTDLWKMSVYTIIQKPIWGYGVSWEGLSIWGGKFVPHNQFLYLACFTSYDCIKSD